MPRTWVNGGAPAVNADNLNGIETDILARLPFWKASTAYTAGQQVVSPSNGIVLAKTAFTSGATYDSANWTSSHGWETVIDIPGTSYVAGDWIVTGGTWASDGAAITQTNTGANMRTRLSKKVLTGMCIVDAEVMVTSSVTADASASIIIGFNGTGGASAVSGTVYRLHLNNTTADGFQIEHDAFAPKFSVTTNWGGLNVWKKVRAVQMGGMASLYVDGVLLGSAGNNANGSDDASYVGFKTNATAAKFRNIKVWNPAMPALP